MKSGILKLSIAILLIAALTPTHAAGEEWTFKFGKSAPGSPRSSKVFGLGYQDHLWWGFHYALQADLLSTPSNPNPASLVIGPGIGIGVEGKDAFVRSTWSTVYLSQEDQELGGHFQFMQDFVVGVQDRFNTVGIGYKHISSAGIEKPNRGKDFIFIQLGVKF